MNQRTQKAIQQTAVEGYIIESENGKFLSKDLFWFPHDAPEEAWVHSKDIVEYLKQHARTWQTKPAKVYPALWNGHTTVGQPSPFVEEGHGQVQVYDPSTQQMLRAKHGRDGLPIVEQ